jgi:hypothetical protein
MKQFVYGLSDYDRHSGVVDYEIHLPMEDVSGPSLPDFLKSAAEKGWLLCGTLPRPSVKGSPMHDPRSPGGTRIVEDVCDITSLIFYKDV